jgi:L-threonylcarbamoyladenylate synthase
MAPADDISHQHLSLAMPTWPGTDAAAITAAAQALARGELVGFPTETVYGLGARADDDRAVARIYAAKGRPAGHPLIVHVGEREAAEAFAAEWSPAASQLVAAFWPGPLTVIVPRRAGMGAAAAGGQNSIGLRMPSHPVALALLRAAAAAGVAGVAAPSANRFGRVSPTQAAHVVQEFGPSLIVLDGGSCEVGIESAIVDCTRERPALLRPGQLAQPHIEAVLGYALALPDAHSPRASGTLAAHYAPAARVQLLGTQELQDRVGRAPAPAAAAPWFGSPAEVHAGPRAWAGVGVYSRVVPAPGWLHRPMPEEAQAVAHELFSVLREFDRQGVQSIWIETPPPGPLWAGVRDRLQRAQAATPDSGSGV